MGSESSSASSTYLALKVWCSVYQNLCDAILDDLKALTLSKQRSEV